MMPIGLSIGLIAAALALGAVVGFLVRRLLAEKKIGSAEAEAKRILSDCAQQAEAMKKERLIEAKEEMLRLRNETEADLKPPILRAATLFPPRRFFPWYIRRNQSISTT